MTILPTPPANWKRPAMPKGVKATVFHCRTSNKFFPRVRGTLEQRFWAKVCPEPNSGCWIWGGDDNGKYGTLGIYTEGKQARIFAHRYSWELHRGPIPAGKQIDHLCCNTFCVNPDHLEVVTPLVNTMRVSERGRRNDHIPTHCKNGHLLEGDHVRIGYRNGRPRRICTICQKALARAHYHRMRAECYYNGRKSAGRRT
jgi:hypothetical protein